MIIMRMSCCKNGKSMMMVACYKRGNGNDKSDNNNKSDNNENKVCLLLRR